MERNASRAVDGMPGSPHAFQLKAVAVRVPDQRSIKNFSKTTLRQQETTSVVKRPHK